MSFLLSIQVQRSRLDLAPIYVYVHVNDLLYCFAIDVTLGCGNGGPVMFKTKQAEDLPVPNAEDFIEPDTQVEEPPPAEAANGGDLGKHEAGGDTVVPADEMPPPPLEPEQRRKRTKKQQQEKSALIQKPPALPPSVAQAAQEALIEEKGKEGSIELNVEDQRLLKRKLDQEAQEKAETKKEEAHTKKTEAAAKALAKAEKKLEQAKAKSAALKEKLVGGVKRKLDNAFANVDDKGGPPASPPKPAAKTRARKTTKQSPNVKLSPKAKAFAANTASAASGSRSPLKDGNRREQVANKSLQLLRGLNLPGLELPPDNFSKKMLGCM